MPVPPPRAAAGAAASLSPMMGRSLLGIFGVGLTSDHVSHDDEDDGEDDESTISQTRHTHLLPGGMALMTSA